MRDRDATKSRERERKKGTMRDKKRRKIQHPSSSISFWRNHHNIRCLKTIRTEEYRRHQQINMMPRAARLDCLLQRVQATSHLSIFQRATDDLALGGGLDVAMILL